MTKTNNSKKTLIALIMFIMCLFLVGSVTNISADAATSSNVSVTLSRTAITMNGTVQRPTVTVKNSSGKTLTYKKDFTVDYSNWNSSAVGRYTVTVKMIGNYSGSKTYPYYINPKSTTISSVTGVANGFTVKWNKQTNSTTGYQIQYATKSNFSNAATVYAGASSATSKTITGRAANTKYYVRIRTYKNINGKYFYSDWSSSKSVTTKTSINSVKVTLSRTAITMNGTVQRPTVTVKTSSGKSLTYKKDFTVSYSNWSSKDVGRYTVTVTMMGNYSGSKTYPYYINPKSTTISSVTGVANGFTVKWNKQTNSTTGYQIQYATKSDFSNGTTVYAGASSVTSKTITDRAANTKYYVRIRTYKNIDGSYFYSDWSSAKSVTTKSSSLAEETCTTINNHSMSVGNICKWFSSRSELESYVSSIGEEWYNKYLNNEITWEQYYASVPSGYECWSCSYCGYWTGNFKYNPTENSEDNESCDHVYKSTVTAPTCTTKGYTTYTCINCGDSYTDNYTDATGHTYGYRCNYDGTHTKCCTVCGYELATASCTLTESNGYECPICGFNTSLCSHNYTSVVTAPTCTTKGYTTHTCTKCNNVIVDNYTEATGHNYTVTMTGGGTHYKYCTNCGEGEFVDCTYVATVTTEPTCTKAGVMTYTCSECGYTYTETISKTGQ